MFIGAVKWFDNSKGFGILALPLGEELFIHIRGFKVPEEEGINPREIIFGTKRLDPKKNSYVAQNCHILKKPEDWKLIIPLLETNNTIMLPDRGKKEYKYNLIDLAAKQLLRGKDKDSIFQMITSDFDSRFPANLFIPYVEFLQKIIPSTLEKGIATELLSRIFQYFGTCVSHQILFNVWKANKFNYIGYEQHGDYEIPEEVFNLNATELGYDELSRIHAYSFGPAFCSEFVNALLDGADTMDRAELKELIPYLDFLENGDKIYWQGIVSADN